MLPRERVIQVLRHEIPDRVPIYGWLSANLAPQISEMFGSVAAFEDRYEFDYAHLFGGPGTYPDETLASLREAKGGQIDPSSLLDVPLNPPDDQQAYQNIIAAIRHHKEERNRFVYVQTPGIFEPLNGVFGIENHLMYLLTEPETLHEVYRRQAEWNRAFADNCLDLGVDMIHVSDDWGSQNGLLFSTDLWETLIYPYHKMTADAVKARDAFLSLHSDGNVNAVIDGIVKLGYDIVHPWQESAGMSLEDHQRNYAKQFTVMGGLDIQTTLGFGKYDLLKHEIERVIGMFRSGGGLYCTTHFVQDHCTMDELVYAYDLIYRLVREPA